MFNIFIVILLVVSANAEVVLRTKVQMGTYISISVDAEDKKYIEDGFEIIKEIDLSLSSYNKDALIYKLNMNKYTALNHYTYEALSLSKKYYEKSDGYFDITVGSITKDLYSFGEDERMPLAAELEKAVVSFNGLHFNEKEASLDKNIKVDLGGMGKGYAVDKVAEYYRVKNVKKALISASGDIRCLDVCTMDVQDPFSNTALLSFKTSKKDLGISTSGNYNRYVKSTKHNHLIDPKSKIPQDKFISITLISSMPNSDLDAYATAASVMPVKKAYEFLESMDVGYIILESDKELRISSSIDEYTTDLVIHDTLKKQP